MEMSDKCKGKEKGRSRVIVLCGKSGSGKDYILRNLIKGYNYTPIISTTTRPIRTNEKNGVDYYFITKKDFANKIDNGDFLEYRSYVTLQNSVKDIWYYGVEKQKLNENKKYVIVLDLSGAKKFIDYYGQENCKCVYVYCDDNIRKSRAMQRDKNFSLEEWNRRLEADKNDFSDDKVKEVCNLRIDNTNENIDTIIEKIIKEK